MKKIKLHDLSPDKELIYILAETAFSHEGDFEYIKKQIEAAVDGGADGVKFQILLDKDNSYSSNYFVYPLFDPWLFSSEEWYKILQHANNVGLEVTVLPVDDAAIDFCMEHKELIAAIEVHSINFNSRPFLEKVAQSKEMLILGVGGRTLNDINYALGILEKGGKHREQIILMHGFQSFPTNHEEIKLERVKKLNELYGCVLGYADHTSYDDDLGKLLNEYAYLNGARIFEKHLVLEKGKKRVDYEAAIEKDDLTSIRKRLDLLRIIQNKANCFDMTVAEVKYKNREKQLIATKTIKKGDILNANNIGFKVNANLSDFEQKDYDCLLGKKAGKSIETGQVLKFGMIL